jgi:hypothetical protein
MKNYLVNFKKIFPLDVEVSQSIINKANIDDTENCIGALSLKEALSKDDRKLFQRLGWGTEKGHQYIKDIGEVVIKSYNEEGKIIDMTEVVKPFKVTFKLSNE